MSCDNATKRVHLAINKGWPTLDKSDKHMFMIIVYREKSV